MAKSSAPTGSLIALNPFNLSSQEFVLHKDHVLIGSDPTNDLVITDSTVSRHHASITSHEGRYEVADLNSTNGTFVNGQRFAGSTRIDKGDELRFGEARFVFSTSGAPSTSAVEKPIRVARLWTQLLIGVIAVALGGLSGFIGGVAASNRVHAIVVARQFVLVDQEGKARGILTVFPSHGEPNCGTCDGRAHLLLIGDQGRAPEVWPPVGGTGLDPATAQALVEALIGYATGGGSLSLLPLLRLHKGHP